MRLDLGYIDPDFDYQENLARAQRHAAPIPTMYSRNAQSLDLAIVFTAAEAKEIAERLLYTVWAQRVRLAFSLGSNFIKLAPADVVTLTLDRGSSFRLRIVKEEIGVGQTQAYEAVIEERALQVAAGATADAGLGFAEPALPTSVNTRLALIDAPYLRDIDATLRATIEVKFAMAGYAAGWQAGTLWDSDDGLAFGPAARAAGAMAYGIVANTLPSGAQNLTDRTTQLTVAMIEGALQSVTDAQFRNNEQVAIIGSPTLQNWEYVAYRDAVQGASGRWTVSTLLRGRRGTDAPEIADSHVAGELFIVADRAAIERILLPLGQHNVARYYRGVGADEFPEGARTVALASRGRPLMPFRPYQLAAALDGGDNIDFAWARSDRLGFELNNAQGWKSGPLSEDSLAFEVDALSGPGGALKRTLPASAEAVQYDNADIITDFGSLPAAITFKVYQLSAQVGRGFASAETTITL